MLNSGTLLISFCFLSNWICRHFRNLNPKIDYLKIPIVKDPDILGKILKNPPKKITKKANKTVETGRMYYMINSDTNKRYIGQTTLTVNERLNDHFKEAKSERDKTYINNSIRDHGQDKFTIHEFQKIENQKQWVLDKLETHYIAKYHTRDPRYDYNIAPGGRGGKHDERTIEKIKQSNIIAKAPLKGKPLSEEHRKKISKGLMNHVHSEETKQKIAQSHKGMITSEKTKKLLSDINTGEKNPFFGKKHSESTIKKMSNIKQGEKNPFHGKHHTKESKKLMSEANKGIPNTPEQKHKISETKIQNFKDANPINEDAFKKDLRNGLSASKLGEKFNLNESSVYTWINHIYGTQDINNARKIANPELKGMNHSQIVEYYFKEKHPINETKFKTAVENNYSENRLTKEFQLTKSQVSTWLKYIYGSRKISEARKNTKKKST